MNSIQVCFSPSQFEYFNDPESIVVVVDVFRATSAMCTAFEYGVGKIIPVATVDEAREYKSKGFLAAAERDGVVIEDFEIGNSPFDYMNPKFKDQTIVISTTNGTQAIEVAKNAYKLIVGSFLNINAVSQFLKNAQRNVIIVCAGWKNKFNLEDSLFAGALATLLIESQQFSTSCDSTLAAMNLYNIAQNDMYGFLENSSHRNRLRKLNLEKDIRHCLTLSIYNSVPILENGVLIKAK
jgi:2-phosphosulfolactate phosphatase